jgi:hypothetical protein
MSYASGTLRKQMNEANKLQRLAADLVEAGIANQEQVDLALTLSNRDTLFGTWKNRLREKNLAEFNAAAASYKPRLS